MANYQYNPVPLSQGGEKVVHFGVMVETGMPVVIKFMRQPYSQEDLNRFSLEVSRLQKAQGMGVARLIDSNLQHHPPFFVEEYFPEGTLAQHMAAQFRTGYVFDDATALDYTEQILTTLVNIHARGVIHRDVKPPNIMMRGRQLVITDMGIGRTLARPTSLQTQAFVGTRYYASPEQEMGGTLGGVDHRTDLYPVGVILHELLTGERGAYNFQIYQGNPLIRTLMARLLMFAKAQRYGSAQEALQIVRQLRRQMVA